MCFKKVSDYSDKTYDVDEIGSYHGKMRSAEITEDTSDGYYTFKELYEFRRVYNTALFNTWAATGLYDVHKSKKHYEGDECFGGGWFIVVAVLPRGQVSNHYELKYWDEFRIPTFETALYPFDGHTPKDVIKRLKGV